MSTLALRVDVVSDIVCPWCYIGCKRLRETLHNQSSLFKQVDVVWHPYRLLPPTFPATVKNSFYREKFGESQYQRARMHVEEEGRSCGIIFNYSDQAMLGPTTDAHRLLEWVPRDKQNALADELFAAHHERGLLISDAKTLVDCAVTACGLDGPSVMAFLQSGRGRTELDESIARARQEFNVMGGVPHMIFTVTNLSSGASSPPVKAVVSGGQSLEYFRLVIERAVKKALQAPAM